MTDFLQRMNNISAVMHEFRKEQERIILHSSNDMKYGKTAKVKLVGPDPTEDEISENNQQNLSKIVNVHVVLMPQPASDSSYKKLWSLGLCVNKEKDKEESKCGLGMIESHGTMWMLVQRKDSQPGFRVIMQTAERNEPIQYLNKELALVSLKSEAAVWNMRNVTHDSKLHVSCVDPSDPNNTQNKGGVFVQFELVGTVVELDTNKDNINGTSNATNTTTSATSSQGGNSGVLPFLSSPKHGPSQLKTILICNHNEIADESSLAVWQVLKDKEQPAFVLDFDGIRIGRSYVWEVMPDRWIDQEIDFLHGYI